MKTLKVIISQEYRANAPSVFTAINGKYVGCLVYPRAAKFPPLEHWKGATSSDSHRGFEIQEKAFTDEEIKQMTRLQNAIEALEMLITPQPYWPPIPLNFKIKRGKAYQAYKVATEAQNAEIKAYFNATEAYYTAKNKAFNELKSILNK